MQRATSCSAASTASRTSSGTGADARDPASTTCTVPASTSTARGLILPDPAADTDGRRASPRKAQQAALGPLPARLARGALGPRRRGQVLPLPERPARHQLVPDARLGDADGVHRPGDHRRDPRDVLQAGPADTAYESIQHITNDVTLGWLVRGMHRWGASVFIILMFLHMARVFLFGAYKYPRELNWIIGVLLLALGLPRASPATCCPWDQTAYWATVVGINLNGTAPFLGPFHRAVPPGRARHRARHARAASTRSTCWSCPGAIIGADRAAPLPRDPPRRHLAAVVEGGRRRAETSRTSRGRPQRARRSRAPRGGGGDR